MAHESLSRVDQRVWDRFAANPTLSLNNEKVLSELYAVDSEVIVFIQGLLDTAGLDQNNLEAFTSFLRCEKHLDLNTMGRRKIADRFSEYFLL